MNEVQGFNQAPPAAQMFGGAGREYRWKYGTKRETFAKISEKARKHAANNPYALFNQLLSVEEIMASRRGVRSAHALPVLPADVRRGGGDPLLATSSRRSTASRSPVYIAAQAMTTDYASSFEEQSMIKMVGYDMAEGGAKKVYEQGRPRARRTCDVVELHDCFTANELLTYEALGLCKEGEAEKFIWDGDNTYGGKFVTNPSGGLLSKGHPLGATGLAQCTELVWQLRGRPTSARSPGAKVALQHNLGLGGACVVTMYRRD